MEELIERFRKLMETFSFLDKYKGIKINSKEDISRIPVSDRDDLADYDISMCPERPIEVFATSGTTKERIFVYISKIALKKMINRMGRIYAKLNIKNRRIISLIGYGNLTAITDIIDAATIEHNNLIIPLGNHYKKQYLTKAIKKLNPDVVIGYTNEIYSFFEKAGKKNNIKKYLAGGELILDEHRRFVNKFGKIDIYSLYACNEVMTIAIQINPKNRKHLVLEGIYTEVIKKNGEISEEGEGELLITDLYNLSMPIIRYKLGDWVKLEKKGREKYITIYGRTGDVINLHGVLISKTKIIEKTMNILHHPEFFFIVRKNEKTAEDIIKLSIPKEDIDKEKQLYDELDSIIGRFKVVGTKLKAPRGNTGKVINFVDLRGKRLEKKWLSF